MESKQRMVEVTDPDEIEAPLNATRSPLITRAAHTHTFKPIQRRNKWKLNVQEILSTAGTKYRRILVPLRHCFQSASVAIVTNTVKGM